MYFDSRYMRQCFYEDLKRIPELIHKKAQLIDLKEDNPIPGFIHLPYRLLYQHLAFIQKDKPVYLLCETGKKSEAAAIELCKLGYTAYSFIGGYYHLKQSEDPSLY